MIQRKSTCSKNNKNINIIQLGYNEGIVINNFNDGYHGSAPDMGAHEDTNAPMEFGVKACIFRLIYLFIIALLDFVLAGYFIFWWTQICHKALLF